jgi:hypothetical protein
MKPMAYEIWDADTGNLQGTYESEVAALDVLERSLRDHGTGYVASLLLGFEDKRGDSHLIAAGEQLIRRIQEHQATQSATA